MRVPNCLLLDPPAVLRYWDRNWSYVLAGLESISGAVSPFTPQVEEITAAVRGRGTTDLYEPTMLEGEQFLVDEGERQPQKIREVFTSPATLDVEYLQY